ncbi:A24 family peptidase [Lentibacillus halophilus]|uniref:A24 family peptidase n=1 Tax=Lentibacillus halophilus TaxID=295065 RepID=A0ABP3IVV1_9BACI
MDILLLLCFFLLGLVFGSFFYVVGLRVPQKQPFANDRSICPHCRHTLTWYELIPILSYIMQRGRCRSCGQRIAITYPVVELASGGLFALSYAEIGFQAELLTALLLMAMVVILFISDIVYMLIPNTILLFFLPLFIIMRVIQPLDPWWSSIVGVLFGTGLLALIILISRGGMGAGDMKLFGVLGVVFGLEKIILTFFLATMIGAVIGLLMLLLQRTQRGQAIPFGPYIVVAAVLAYFFGDGLLNWYLGILS